MFLKSLVIASSAAILAPILGAYLFLGIWAFDFTTPVVTGKSSSYKDVRNLPINDNDSVRSFAARGLRSAATDASVLLPEVKQKVFGAGSWQTTTSCADGNPVLKHKNCDQFQSIDVAKKSELADGQGRGKPALPPCVESKKLSRDRRTTRRMTLGGPCID